MSLRACCEADLAPVSLRQNPAVATVNPAMGYPMGTGPRRLFPPSRGPDVSVAFPTMVPGNPHMVTAGPRRTPLVYSMGWRDANHNIDGCGVERERACKNQSDQSFKKHNANLHFLVPNREPTPAAGEHYHPSLRLRAR
jgi:hypothetical protein